MPAEHGRMDRVEGGQQACSIPAPRHRSCQRTLLQRPGDLGCAAGGIILGLHADRLLHGGRDLAGPAAVGAGFLCGRHAACLGAKKCRDALCLCRYVVVALGVGLLRGRTEELFVRKMPDGPPPLFLASTQQRELFLARPRAFRVPTPFPAGQGMHAAGTAQPYAGESGIQVFSVRSRNPGRSQEVPGPGKPDAGTL